MFIAEPINRLKSFIELENFDLKLAEISLHIELNLRVTNNTKKIGQ